MIIQIIANSNYFSITHAFQAFCRFFTYRVEMVCSAYHCTSLPNPSFSDFLLEDSTWLRLECLCHGN